MQTETDYVITALYSSVLVTLLIAIVIGIALFICERVLKHTPLRKVFDGLEAEEYNEYENCGSVLTDTRPLNNKERLKVWRYKYGIHEYLNGKAKQLAPRTFPPTDDR